MADRYNPCPIEPGDTCSECPLASSRNPEPIAGFGPRDAEIMFVGGGPAYHETREGIPFVGVTGEELNGGYLPRSGLSRPRVYTTNATKCWDRKRKDVPDSRVLACAEHHLRYELETVRPELVVLMGASANLLRGPDISVELEHGRTVSSIILDHSCYVHTTLHPAAGLHSTGVMRDVQGDFDRLGEFIRTGSNPWPVDQYAGRYLFTEATADKDWCFEPPQDGGPVAIDTELLGLNSWIDPLWCLSYSTAPDNGFLIRAGDREALKRFRALIKGRLVIIQGYTFDVPPLARMGIYPSDIIDTQTLFYNRGYFGHAQSLKSLGYRLLGVRMKEFNDLVRPYASEALVAYLATARELEYPHPGGRKKSVNSRIDRFIKDCVEKNADALKKWGQWDSPNKGAIKRTIAKVMGTPAPRLTIDLVPFREALEYACLDANVTRRIWYWIQDQETAYREGVRPDPFKVAKADIDLW